MPTPRAKSLRSNSIPCTVSDVSSAKDDIISTFKNELEKVCDTLESLSGRMNNIEIRLAEVESKQADQENEIKIMKDELNNLSKLESKVTDQENEIKTLKGNLSCLSNSSSPENDFYDEIEMRMSKRENLIIFGVPESETGSVLDRKAADESYLNHLIQELDIQNFEFKRLERIGKISANRGRLLKVSGVDLQKKQEILRRSRGLRNSNQYKRVFINADLTPMQRQKQRELQSELRDRRTRGEDVIISRGKVQPRDQANFHQSFYRFPMCNVFFLRCGC